MRLNIVLFYIITFSILYLEPIEIVGGLTFGIIWKILLMGFLFLPILYRTLVNRNIEIFAFLYILFAIKTLISYSSMEYLMNTITFSIKVLMFPLLYLFFIKFNKERLLFIAKHFSIVVILSFIPYMLGLLEPLGEGYDLSAYGLEGSFGLVGPFINPHSASIALAFAMIIITTLINGTNTLRENLFYIFLILLGFYILIGTYVRTGVAIYAAALLYFYLQNISFKKIVTVIISLVILFGIGLYMVETNEALKMRFEDRNKYIQHDELGSGRLTYWKTAVENWANDEKIVLFIGLGEMYAEEKMERVVGLKIFAHNEFFQMLQQEGLIGFLLFLSALFFLFGFIRQNRESQYYLHTMSIFVGMITMMMFQGGFYFNIIFSLSLYLAVLKQDNTIKL